MYMEISGLPVRNLLKYFPEFERNPDKIIFGSDWSGTDPSVKKFVDEVRALPIAEAGR